MSKKIIEKLEKLNEEYSNEYYKFTEEQQKYESDYYLFVGKASGVGDALDLLEAEEKEKKYFFKISICYTDKNKYYKAYREAVEKLDGTLISSPDELKKFKKKLYTIKNEMRGDYKQCKEIYLDIDKVFKDLISIRVSGSWSASIYEILKTR